MTLQVKPIKPKTFLSFEQTILKVYICDSGWLTLVSIYRLDYVSITCFFEEFTELLETLCVQNSKYIIAGDINIHCDDPHNVNTIRLNELLSLFQLTQIIGKPTHRAGHTLDVVILQNTDIDSTEFEVNIICLSDHFLLRFSTTLKASKTLYKDLTYRGISKIDMNNFRNDVNRTLTNASLHNKNVGEYVNKYNQELSTFMNKYAPLITKKVKIVENAPWFDDEYRHLRKRRLNAEKKFKRSNNPEDKNQFIALRKATTTLACRKKQQFYLSTVKEAINKPRSVFGVVSQLMGANKESALPTARSDVALASNFQSYFREKILKIRESFTQSDNAILEPSTPAIMSVFEPASEDELRKIITTFGIKCSPVDPIPTKLLSSTSYSYPFGLKSSTYRYQQEAWIP